AAEPNAMVAEGQPLAFIEEAEVAGDAATDEAEVNLDEIRPDLAEVLERRALTQDAARPDAVARRRKTGQRTARENIDAICDPGSFIEYGAFTLAAQRARRRVDDLMRSTPVDGLMLGIGSVNGELLDDARSRCMVLAYDYPVLAVTQGTMNHKKPDRMLTLAEEQRLPIIIFAEGGGGRPGDTDNRT